MIFLDRLEAGQKLALRLEKFKSENPIILAIPRGGIAVALPVAQKLKASLDLVIPRKIPIPENPEAGFGAVTADGPIVLNEPIVQELGYSPEIIKKLSQPVIAEVKRRLKQYRGDKPFPDFKNKTVIIIDDGLASGYTMIAAVKSIRKLNPQKIIVAIPVSPRDSIERVKPLVEEIICLYIEEGWGSFAVASYYQEFRDLEDEEVLDFLKKAHF